MNEKSGDLLSSICPLRLGFGGAAISGEGGGYGFGEISEQNALGLLEAAFDLGITLFDTAPIYGFGLSEKRIGMAFKKKREKVFLVSKSGVTWHSTKRVDMTNDPQVAERMLEQSLRDLQTEYIDLYMIHWPDSKVDIRRPMEVLSKAKAQGKVKHIGLCNTYTDDLNKAQEVDNIEAVQCSFSFFDRRVREELFPVLKEKNISFMGYGTLEKGILTKRVVSQRKFDPSDCRAWAPWWKASDKDKKMEIVAHLAPEVEKSGHTMLELALGFVLSHREVSSALCGARSREQLESLVKALAHLPHENELKKFSEIAGLK